MDEASLPVPGFCQGAGQLGALDLDPRLRKAMKDGNSNEWRPRMLDQAYLQAAG